MNILYHVNYDNFNEIQKEMIMGVYKIGKGDLNIKLEDLMNYLKIKKKVCANMKKL